MKKIKLSSFGLIEKFKEHSKYKKELLKHFKEKKLNIINTNFNQHNQYQHEDNINNLDWIESRDFKNREWVKLIKTDLQKHFEKCANKLNLKGVVIKALWFQQYEKMGFHGWHIHEDNYTGVYYVDFKNNFAKTQLIDPATNKKIIIDAKEGDILIFPSYVVHCSPVQKIDRTKTIISFNLTFDRIDPNFIKKINK